MVNQEPLHHLPAMARDRPVLAIRVAGRYRAIDSWLRGCETDYEAL